MDTQLLLLIGVLAAVVVALMFDVVILHLQHTTKSAGKIHQLRTINHAHMLGWIVIMATILMGMTVVLSIGIGIIAGLCIYHNLLSTPPKR